MKRAFVPLPPGMVPSDSRENMLDIPSPGQKQWAEEGPLSNKENLDIGSPLHAPVSDARSRSVEKGMSSLSLSCTACETPPTYHIDLNSEVKGEREAGTTKVKISGPMWSPMKHRNKVAPLKTAKQGTHTVKQAFLSASNEGPLSTDESKKPINDERPCSAPPMKQELPVTGMVVSAEGAFEGLVEIHSSYIASSGPPVYSEVVKSECKETNKNDDYDEVVISHQTDSHSPVRSETPPPVPQFGEEEKARYIQDLVALSPGTFSSPPMRRTASATSSIIQVLQDRAKAVNDNDSLYDSMLDENEGAPNRARYSEVDDLDPNYLRGLQNHDTQQAGGIQLISVKGVTAIPSNAEIAVVSQGLPPDMQQIHHVSALGDRKALQGIISLLPIIQDPVEMVLGSAKFRVREGVDVKDGQGRTPLMHAVYNGHIGCVKILAEAGANVNIEAQDGSTCLHHAAFAGTPQMLALLLSLGANGIKKDMEGRVPLHWAANNDDPQNINILLDKVPGLDANVRDGSKMTALMWAAYYGQVHNIDALRKRGADSTMSDVDGLKAIHWSVKSGNTRALQILLSTESSGYCDNRGRTVMHVAAEHGFSRAVEMIRSTRPLSVNDQDNNRRSPLHWATVCEKPEAIRALTTTGADPALYDSRSMTALDYAISRGLHYCGLLLAQAIEERIDREAAIGYHHVLSVGGAASIGVRTLVQQEGAVNEPDIDEITDEQILQMKTVCAGGWINKFTSDGKGPLHCRFFWIDPQTMTIHWAKSVESRYISSKDTKNDRLVGVRTSASSCILQRRDFDPLDKHKYAFTIFTNSKVLDMIALSSDDFKIWLNGIQLLLNLGSEVANELMNGTGTKHTTDY